MAQAPVVVTYDVAVIHEFAQQLYRKSERREKQGVMLGFLIGMALAVSLVSAISLDTLLGRWPAVGFSFVVVAFCTWLGMKLGLSAGLKLKLEAQLALCQAAIEQNTRR
jgi:hypothetical protein